MGEELPLLNFTFKEDLAGQHFNCFQVLDGSIFYYSNLVPAYLYVITKVGKRIDGDISALEVMDYLDIHVLDNSICFSMHDYYDKAKEDWSRRCFQASVADEKVVLNEIGKIPYDEQLHSNSILSSPYTVEVNDSQLILRNLCLTREEKPVKVIEMPGAVVDEHRTFFRDTIFTMRNSESIHITRINEDSVDVQLPIVLMDKLTVHGYADSDVLYLVNTGHDYLIAINATDLTHRFWKFDRPSTCPFDSYDYSVGIRDGVLTVRFLDSQTNKAQLWTAKIF